MLSTMKNTHTLIPWDIFPSHKRDEITIGVSDGSLVHAIANVPGLQPTDYANARLIAAAPKLLAALQGLFKECSMIHKHWGDGNNTHAADAAIAAAESAIAVAVAQKHVRMPVMLTAPEIARCIAALRFMEDPDNTSDLEDIATANGQHEAIPRHYVDELCGNLDAVHYAALNKDLAA